MFDPASAEGADAKRTMSELSQMRGEIDKLIAAAEARWIEMSELVAG
jgi:hypothetical protein